MSVVTVDAKRGWDWFQDGWELFRKQPGMWSSVILVYTLIVVALSFIPIIGQAVASLISIMLAAGIVYAASRLDRDGTLDISQLFQAFRDPTRVGPMVILAAICLMGNIVSATLVQLVGAGFIGFLLFLVMVALFYYSIPLVMLGDQAPSVAIKSSLEGCLQNWLPLLIFSFIFLVLASLLMLLSMIPISLFMFITFGRLSDDLLHDGAMFTFWAGFLPLGAVAAGAWYQSYKDIYNQ